MAEEDHQDIAPEDTGEATHPHSKGRQSFNKVRRELSDDELSSPAVQRLLLDDIERLEKENEKSSVYQDKYHETDKKAAVLNEKLKSNVAQDVIFGVCLTVGAALIGVAPSLWTLDKSYGWYSVALGVVLIMCGIASKVVKL